MYEYNSYIYIYIYIKTQPEVKAKAQKIAKNKKLRQLVTTKKVVFNPEEERLSKYLIESIKKSEEQLKRGETSPAFDNAKDAIDWLEKQGI